MKFTGHERDPETGLDYMLARYYTAGSGRFLQVDPGYDYDKTDPMSFNLYGYVRGNPVMGTDPTGEVWSGRRELNPHLEGGELVIALRKKPRRLAWAFVCFEVSPTGFRSVPSVKKM